MFSNVICAVLGRNGKGMLELGDLVAAYCDGLFHSYYQQEERRIGEKAVRNLCKGVTMPPRWFVQHYGGAVGRERLYNDLDEFVYSCVSLHKLRCMKKDVQWVLCSYGIATQDIRYGEREDLTRDEVAEYLTDALLCAIQRPLLS